MNRCRTCAYRGEEGYCSNPHIHEFRVHHDPRRDEDLVYSYAEDGGFWVGPEFGCVHYSQAGELYIG